MRLLGKPILQIARHMLIRVILMYRISPNKNAGSLCKTPRGGRFYFEPKSSGH